MHALRKFTIVGALVVSACAPSYGAVEFDAVSTPPVSVTIRSFLIEMPAGVAAVVRADAISGNNNEYEGNHKIDLFSRDKGVLTVHRRASRSEFVFVGVAEGSTCLQVEVDGRPEECIDVEVTAPEGV